jgi:hypothetical protein
MKNIVNAIVKYPAREPRLNRFGRLRINVVCTLPDGADTTLWANPDDPIATLRKGDRCILVEHPNGYNLLPRDAAGSAAAPDSAPTAAAHHRSSPAAARLQAPTDPGWQRPDQHTRQQMIQFAEFVANVHLHAFRTVSKTHHDTGLQSPELKDIATSVTLAVLRRWRLQ